jgi:hypothetical protein
MMRGRLVRMMSVASAVVGVMALTAVVGATPAQAVAPWWRLHASGVPTDLPPGEEAMIVVRARNLGDAEVEGELSPVTIVDELPAGLTVTEATATAGFKGIRSTEDEEEEEGIVPVTRPPVVCNVVSSTVTCTFGGKLPPYEEIEVRITVQVGGAISGAKNEVSVSGGRAPSVSIAKSVSVDPKPAAFGVESESYEVTPENEGGTRDTQAGSHPFQLTTARGLNQTVNPLKPPALPKDLRFKLPAGLIGNATVVPQCTELQFATSFGTSNDCPAITAVGVAMATISDPPAFGAGTITDTVPVFNLTPRAGEPARFGFEVANVPVFLDTSVRTGQDYGVTLSVRNINESIALIASEVTLWGVPGDPRHSQSRGWHCVAGGRFNEFGGSCTPVEEGQVRPFLRLPTSCTGALKTPAEVDSWADPGSYLAPVEPLAQGGTAGCAGLPFNPEIEVAPDTPAANTPTGLNVDLKVPQEASENPNGLAESDVKNTTVTLPAGLQINPAAADGLQACSEAQVGFTRLEASGEAIFSEGEAQCPEASKLGTVEITTPLLKEALKGAVYQAAQGANPFGSLLALYVVAENKNEGVRVKLAGKVEPNPTTGQLVSTFDQTPQLPFAEFDLKFFGGNQAPLATSGCGAYRTTSSIEPWSGNPAASPFSEFNVTSGPNGTPCQSPQPFAPSFVAGTTNNQAAAFSPFTVTLSRRDGEQTLGSVSMTMPRGLAGMVAKVALCGEAQANAGACSAASQIGHVTVQAGVGKEPITLPEAGKPEDPVYLTGPYEGAPFGLAIVVHPEAGPFNLEEGGKPVIVRAKIEVNPHTSQVSVLSNAMPTILQGIPLDVRTIDVTIDREGFMFNPTNCNAMSIAGAIGSNEGASESVSSRFQAANCANLPFKPSFSALTHANPSRNYGAYLHVVVKSGAGQANVGSVKVQLPKSLPARLSTLNLACLEKVFNENPAACPAGSKVGSATAYTPVLPVALTGPAYFVSHGGAKFPELVLVLQGDGVTLDLAGETFISSKGITSSTFRSVPDVPITRFDLVLPAGAHSALAGNGSFCTGTMYMPTQIKGQNGAVVKQNTKVAVTGCKPAVTVVRSSVKGAKATIVASVPSAGRLVASGKGLSRVTRRLGKAGTTTVTLTLSKQDQLFLSQHPGRRLKVSVKLIFTPAHGSRLSASVTLLMG